VAASNTWIHICRPAALCEKSPVAVDVSHAAIILRGGKASTLREHLIALGLARASGAG